jgi:hypothetical protein
VIRRERIEKKASKKPRQQAEILPLDPRDPEILRAKASRPSVCDSRAA